MDSVFVYVALAVALLAILAVLAVVLLGRRGESKALPRPGIDYAPGVGDDDTVPRDTPRRSVEQTIDVSLLEGTEPPLVVSDDVAGDDRESVWEIEIPESAAGRLTRLRRRLARSQSSLGRGLLTLLSRDTIDAATWDEIEETLIGADVGVAASAELMAGLRTRVRSEGPATPDAVRSLLREELLALVDPTMDRTLRTEREGDGPAVVLIVGVNGTGKTTTTGKLGRLLVAEGRTVVLGAADTFRAAAAEQLQTWGDRVGAAVVRGPEGGDPAAVAFDAVRIGTEADVDTVVIDTAGRLHTKVGLMDELGKVKRVIEKQAPVDEVLLVLDATTGQNGLTQATVFSDVVQVTGIVLTKLDGTAKGGIVVAVQRALGVPVKLVGLGEGPDDLAPFEPEAFVDALLADEGMS
ncbi:MAG: signal recognition particle-docking protein FtsY [Candidatus Nanopelagicales bacterium]|jgi:fused signal recognition particle receptor|nr:signal recognition particle-docking protein FtsY [Candidatus Nanopelagicales bacterium]MDP4714382.1 signal recognition particle-docking protein FtsY [Candidatus Nanopelagicales bacterium]MDP4905857.1 signal recognition particle-docking protein FtsY [Candidatus Nanopelagicales bacterium]MDP4975471.1 signal recognition particle-docking protein FtsY [Candidatus Nanopelagicales bacterium]MDP5094367.1 signal recognition particle-docking protein FtsY [Candidatus Nanopelagicales bacterium]